MNAAGLFAGIGGIEIGLSKAGHTTNLLCEIDDAACAVLDCRFPTIPKVRDVRDIDVLPSGTDLLAAGFPCQDLSQAGNTRGLAGHHSSLVDYVFEILGKNSVPWVLLENVPFMLQLKGGQAIEYIVTNLERLDYRWAYRIIDSRAFGLPQRRQRVFLLASRDRNPAKFLYADDAGAAPTPALEGRACGFYWTEGSRGLGWAVDAVPTLKSGSTIGIPSPPAIWLPSGQIVTPDVRDAERLQGFRADWTKPAENVARRSIRWKLVGNAVTVHVARWIGELLTRTSDEWSVLPVPLRARGPWPPAACGFDGARYAVDVSAWPVRTRARPLEAFLKFDPKPLSAKATIGFIGRLESSSLRYPVGFMSALRRHAAAMSSRHRTTRAASSRS